MPPALNPHQLSAYNTANSIQAPTPSQSDGGSVLSRLLPTIGGIAAPLIGGLLAPETGGLSLLAGLGLSAGGSAAGKALENTSEGQDVGSGLGTAALEGAAGQGLGHIGGAVLGNIGGLLGRVGEKAGATTAAKVAADETQNLTHEFGQAMPSANEQTARGLGSAVNLAKELGVDTTQPGTAQGMLDLSNNADQFLQGVKSDILTEGGPVDMTGMTPALKQAVESNIGTVGAKSGPGTKTFQQLTRDYQTQVVGPEGSLNEAGIDPAKASAYVSSLGRQVGAARDALNKQVANSITGVADPGLAKELKLAQDVYNSAKKVVFDRPEVNASAQAIKDMTPEEVAARVPGISPTSPVAQHLADVVNKAEHMQHILDSDSKFVRMNQLANDAVRTNTEAVATGGANNAAKAGAKAAQGGLNEQMGNVAAAAGGHHTAIPFALRKVFTNPAAVEKLAKGGSKVLNSKGVKGGAAQAVAQLIAHAPSLGPDTSGTDQSLTGGLGGNTMQQAPITGSTLANGSPVNSNNILAQLDAMLSANPSLAGSLAPVIQSLVPHAQAAQAAQAGLGQYENTLQAAGGPQGPIGGLLTRLGSLFTGGPASQVGAQQRALEQLLAQAGAPGVQLPGLYSNAAGANASLGQTQSVLGALGGQ